MSSPNITWGSFEGQLADGCDLINMSIEPNAVDPATVEFVLECGDSVTWWKGIIVPDGLGSSWEIWTKNERKADRVSLWADQVRNGQLLVFRKAKLLGWPTPVYWLGELDSLGPGSRVTFRWVQDRCVNNAALFESQTVPNWMKPAQNYDISITMRNVGDAWMPDRRYKLGSQNPPDNTLWGLNRVEIPSRVGPFGTVTFSFSITAPSVPDDYNFHWRMVQENVEWFGELTHNVKVHVYDEQPSPPPPPLEPEMTVVPGIVGMLLQDASYVLQEARIKIGIVVNTSDEIHTDKLIVTHQDLDPGTVVEINKVINLRVSKLISKLLQQGIKQLNLYNCNTDNRPVYIWVFDETERIWARKGQINSQYDTRSRICPSSTAIPMQLTFKSHYPYIVVAVDEGSINCDRNDPTIISCRRWSVRLVGDDKGQTLAYIIS